MYVCDWLSGGAWPYTSQRLHLDGPRVQSSKHRPKHGENVVVLQRCVCVSSRLDHPLAGGPISGTWISRVGYLESRQLELSFENNQVATLGLLGILAAENLRRNKWSACDFDALVCAVLDVNRQLTIRRNPIFYDVIHRSEPVGQPDIRKKTSCTHMMSLTRQSRYWETSSSFLDEFGHFWCRELWLRHGS